MRDVLGVSVGWIGISMVADGVPAVLLPHRLVADGGSDATTLGLISLIAITAAALAQPVAGRWSDRVGRTAAIGVGTTLSVAGLALLISPGAALPGAVLALAGASVAQAGQQALLPDRIGAAWRGRAAGLKGVFDVAGAFAGFLILGALLGRGQTGLAIAALAATLVMGAWLTRVLMRSPTQAVALPAARDANHLAAGRPGALARLVLARFLFLLGIYAVGRFLLLFLADRLTLGADPAAGAAGAVLAVLALMTVAASLPAGWLTDRLGRRPVMVLGGALGAAGIALLPSAHSLEAVIAFGGLMAVGTATFGSASWAMLADLSVGGASGSLMGLANLGTAAAAAGAGLFGVLIDASGFTPAFMLAAACALAGGAMASALVERPRTSAVLAG